jgi:hypothetical protein
MSNSEQLWLAVGKTSGLRRGDEAGDSRHKTGKKLTVISCRGPHRTTAGPQSRLEADREKAGASDLCKGQKL